jgi:large subunit ribosomal protein L22
MSILGNKKPKQLTKKQKKEAGINNSNTATLKFIRLSPIKARLIGREVQGMNAEVAIASLEFTPNKAAGIISKVVASAVANAGLEPEEAVVVSCRVDRAPVLKRFTPRARGSASPKHKPMAHIFVEVAKIEGDK